MMSPWGNMMNWGGFAFFGLIGSLLWLIILVDLILVGVWLWQQIQRGKK